MVLLSVTLKEQTWVLHLELLTALTWVEPSGTLLARQLVKSLGLLWVHSMVLWLGLRLVTPTAGESGSLLDSESVRQWVLQWVLQWEIQSVRGKVRLSDQQKGLQLGCWSAKRSDLPWATR